EVVPLPLVRVLVDDDELRLAGDDLLPGDVRPIGVYVGGRVRRRRRRLDARLLGGGRRPPAGAHPHPPVRVRGGRGRRGEAGGRKPELIVIHEYAYEGQGDVAAKRAALREIPSLGDVPVAILPLGCSLGGLRSVEGLARLRAAIKEHS